MTAAVTTPSPIVQYVSHIDGKHVKLSEKTLGELFGQLRQKYMNEGIEKQKVVHTEGTKSRLQLSASILHGDKVAFELKRIVRGEIAKKPVEQSENIMHIVISLESRRCEEALVIHGKYKISTEGPIYENAWESINDIPDVIFQPCIDVSKIYDIEVKKDFDPGITPTQLLNDILNNKKEIFTNHMYGDITVRIKRNKYIKITKIYVQRISTDQMLLKMSISNDILSSAEKYEEAMRMSEEKRRIRNAILPETDNPPYHYQYEIPGSLYYEVFDATKTWVKEFNSAIHLYMRMGCLILENTALW